jgi:hypothetical protein
VVAVAAGRDEPDVRACHPGLEAETVDVDGLERRRRREFEVDVAHVGPGRSALDEGL